MNNPKLLEAIAELESQRRVIDDAIMHLRQAHDTLAGTPIRAANQSTQEASGAASYVDQSVEALQVAGKELHVSAIVDFISKLRGEKINRASVESSLIRHKDKVKNPRVVKVGRSTYDLSERHQPTLAQIA